jgi:cellobiose transport system substrate-binding protein
VTTLALGLAAASLTACSSGTASSSASVNPKTAKGTITIWYRPGSVPSSAISGVKTEFPHVHFNIVASANVDTKVAAALRTGTGLPDITTGDPVVYAPVANKFVNIGANGFDSTVAKRYASFKVKLGQTETGEQIGVPIDIGPIAFYYNAPAFKAAGLPTDPTAVGKLVSTWTGYKKLAGTVKAAGKFACDSPAYLFRYSTWSQSALFYSKSGSQLVYNPVSPIAKTAFMQAMDFEKAGLCANVTPYSPDWSSSVSQGKTVAFIDPPWIGAGLLSSSAPKQAGQWRVATQTPGGYGSEDGSELVLPKTAANPKLATAVAIWLTNPANMSSGFTHDGLFPSTIASYSSKDLSQPQPYFGGQKVGSLLGSFAQKAPALPKGKNTDGTDTVYMNAIINAETNGQSASAAYQAAVSTAKTQFGN